MAAKAPSSAAQLRTLGKEQTQNPVLNGRPLDNRGQSIFLYHPIFDRYQKILGDREWTPTAKNYQTTQVLVNSSADLYSDELQRTAMLKPLLSNILGYPIQSIRNDDNTSGDGAITVGVEVDDLISCLLLNMVVKNEIGEGHSDPSIQAVMLFRKFCVQQNVSQP